MKFIISAIFCCCFISTIVSFSNAFTHHNNAFNNNKLLFKNILPSTSLFQSNSPVTTTTGTSSMSIDEIKSELELRTIDYSDCISRQELVQKLEESRVLGKANPNVINQFNEIMSNNDKNGSNDVTTNIPNVNEILDSGITDEITAKDGSLPGGMSPQLMRALASDPEIIKMLRDPKMQNIMSAVMTDGPKAMQKYLSDPDAMLLLTRLSKAIERSAPK